MKILNLSVKINKLLDTTEPCLETFLGGAIKNNCKQADEELVSRIYLSKSERAEENYS